MTAVTQNGSRVLVIGASGLVGWHVAKRLAAGEVTVVGFRNVSAGMRSLDVREPTLVRALITETAPSVIVLAAADPSVEGCERDPDSTRRVNVDGVRNVVAAAAEIRSRVVYFSSDYVFDGSSQRPYAEDAATSPINEYGRQKVEAESVVLSEPTGLVCRISGVFGWERGRQDCRNFVCQVIQRLERGERVRAASDQTLCPTYAEDIAVAVDQLIAAGVSGVIHVVGPDAMTRAAFARLVADAFRLSVDRVDAVATRDLGLAAARPAFSALATARLRSAGVRAPRSPRVALAEMATERWL